MMGSGVILDSFTRRPTRYTYDIGYLNIKLIKDIQKLSNSNEIDKTIERYEEQWSKNDIKIYIVDSKGNVMYHGTNNREKFIDLQPFINKQEALQEEIRYTSNKTGLDYCRVSLVKINNEVLNVLLTGTTNINPPGFYDYILKNTGRVQEILMVGIFIIMVSLFTRAKLKYIKEICSGLNEIAKGKLECKIRENGKDELQLIAVNINNMAEELERKIENERRLEQSKQDLITNVAHDLRTPLTNIIGYIEIIREGSYKSENELLKYVDIISKKAEGLKKLINDLFMYTKLSSGRVKLNISKFSINELIEQLIDEYIDLFESNNLRLIDDLTSETIVVNGDPDKLARIFDNLFTNAIKYSIKPSEVNLKLIKKGERVVISISNICDNLDEEDINNLFERFYMVDKSRSENENSSGLGLAISKTIAELHNGNLTADYKDGVITFNLEITI